MPTFNRNLNIHYSLPKEYWDKISSIYQSMPSWVGYIDGIPHWFSDGTEDKVVNASVEPSGLQFYAVMNEEEWVEWFELFKKNEPQTSLVLKSESQKTDIIFILPHNTSVSRHSPC